VHACFEAQVAVYNQVVEANRNIDLVQINLKWKRADYF
jgi:hypothetical protein